MLQTDNSLQTLKFISSISLLLAVISSYAQTDSVAEKKKNFRPYDVKVGVNVIRGWKTYFGSGKDSQEFEVALALHRSNLVFNYGIEENKRGGSFHYQNDGNYFRAGIDRNFVKNQGSGNVLSLGLRYARANFEDALTFTTDNGLGKQNITLSNPDLQSRWIELVFNVRGKIVANLYAGFTLRWQVAKKVDGEGELRTFDIPGFGNTKRKNSTAFDYYLVWRIPLGKTVN